MSLPEVLRTRHLLKLLSVCLVGALQACGGGGGGGENTATQTGTGTSTNTGFFDAPFVSSASLAGQCSSGPEKQFIRSYLDEVYLWPELVQRKASTNYQTAADYFDAILAPSTVDRFSFSSSSQEADNMETAESYDVGIHWAQTGTDDQPVWRIARVEPNSPAMNAGLRRGDTLFGRVSTSLGTNATTTNYYDFSYLRNGGLFQAKLTPTQINEDPVGQPTFIDRKASKVGYLGFESHYGNAQDQLIESIYALRYGDINELVIDLRYNSGGFLYISGTLASMLTPASTLTNQPIFIRLQPNSKQTSVYQGAELRMTSKVQYAEDNARYKTGTALPQLQLKRVYVLTTGATCSASESLINGLRGVGLTVHTIGETTCGKPYGMSRKDNCGTAYYPIEFRGVNARGESDFSNGFAPTCTVPDDLNNALGDPQEALLKAALSHMETGSCPANNLVATRSATTAQMSPRPLGSGYTPPQRQRPGLAILQPAR
jgi:C-terminal processing protease CtpA/Prc